LEEAGTLQKLSREPLVVAAAARLAELTAETLTVVDAFHQKEPLLEGIPKEDLRGRAAPGARGEVFRAALERLAAAGEIAVTGDIVKRAGRRITLAPDEARARQQIEAAFAQAALSVPSVREVLARLSVDLGRAQKILQMLVREQVLVKIAEDLVYHRDAIASVRELLVKYKGEKGAALSVPAFKELTGVSRKYAIPLLEYLDRERVTRRSGDARVIL